MTTHFNARLRPWRSGALGAGERNGVARPDMDRFQRIFITHRLLGTRKCISRRELEQKLECSEDTVRRVVRDLRDHLGAPVEYDRERNGYYYHQEGNWPYQIPGLWFTAGELAAFAVLTQLLARLEPGLLREELAPLRRRITTLIQNEQLSLAHLQDRIRILDSAGRRPGEAFHSCAEALLRERRLHMQYRGRARDRGSERTVSPQRLTHYRDNWYLDAWCHKAQALRTFSVDRIRRARVEPQAASLLDAATLNAELAEAYGIFSGPATQNAVLEFSPERARWVADESWHPEQKPSWTADGAYRLEIPYGDDRELIGDILRHGAHVTVLAPETLRQAVVAELTQARALYE